MEEKDPLLGTHRQARVIGPICVSKPKSGLIVSQSPEPLRAPVTHPDQLCSVSRILQPHKGSSVWPGGVICSGSEGVGGLYRAGDPKKEKQGQGYTLVPGTGGASGNFKEGVSSDTGPRTPPGHSGQSQDGRGTFQEDTALCWGRGVLRHKTWTGAKLSWV